MIEHTVSSVGVSKIPGRWEGMRGKKVKTTKYRTKIVMYVDIELPEEGSDELRDGWKATTHEEAMVQERSWMRGEDGQGDYLETVMQNHDTEIAQITFAKKVVQ